MTYGLNDICLVPARISDIEHREQCNPYNADNMLPLFTAPMSSVINESNYHRINITDFSPVIHKGFLHFLILAI